MPAADPHNAVSCLIKATPLLLVLCGCFGCAAVAAAQGLALPLKQNLPAGASAPLWTQDLSPGASLEVKDAALHFEAPAHARAHLQRPAETDWITFSATLSRWASLYLVWNADNWCGVGQISPTPFGRFYSTVIVGGKDGEVDHRGISFGVPYHLRIRLGTNYLRFAFSTDGKQWTELRTVERPKEFAGAPKLLAVGKYYTADDKPFGPKTAAAPAGPDIRMDGTARDLAVDPTPPGARTLSPFALQALHKAKTDPVTAILARSQDDPTFEKIVRYYPPFRFPREVVGVPAHPLDIGVDWLGRLNVSTWGPPVAWLEVGNPPMPLGREGAPFTRRLLRGYLPIDTLTAVRDGITYELTIFGWSEGLRVDRPLFAYVQLTAHAAAGIPLPQHVALASPDGKRQSWSMAAGPAHSAQFCLRFPFPDPASAEEITPAEFRTKQDEVAAEWEKRLAPAARFDVPDRRVMEAYRAWLVYSMLNADTINGYIEPHDGAGFYEEMFGLSVSLHTRALDYYGLHDYAAQIIDTQLHFQAADGLYTQACGLTDPGTLLVSLAKHYEMTGDRAWLRRVSPNIVRQCEWLIRQREAAPREGVTRGLIKFRPYNDYPDPVFNYLGNAWCAEGMAAVAPLLGIGMPEGQRYAAEAASYRRDILASMKAAAITDQGEIILPLEPDTHRLLKLSRYRGGDYYGLTASSLLETEFLAPNDPQTSRLADIIVEMLEKRGGLIAGVCEFQGGIDHAYTYGYLMNALERGEVRKALLGFWSMLAFGMTRDTYSPVEITQITTGENQFTLPHLYSCTEQLRLLRNLILREEDNVLWIGQGIPRAWLAPGRHVALHAAPSEFGDVSCRIQALADGTMEVHLDPPTRHTPGEIRLCLRQPQRRPIAAVQASPTLDLRYSGETIFLHKLHSPVTLRVHFK